MKKIIHVNQHNIRANRKHRANLPVITVKTYKDNTYCSNVTIFDKNGDICAKVIYSPDKPLSCGAVCWIETKNEVKID